MESSSSPVTELYQFSVGHVSPCYFFTQKRVGKAPTTSFYTFTRGVKIGEMNNYEVSIHCDMPSRRPGFPLCTKGGVSLNKLRQSCWFTRSLQK